MTSDQFQKELLFELNKHESLTIRKIEKLLEHIPEKAKVLEFSISPSEDGDGIFGIYANVDGPDLYVLNKTMQDYAAIFNIKHTPEGIIPYVPTVDPFDEEFDVNDSVVECVSKWIKTIWLKKIGRAHV